MKRTFSLDHATIERLRMLGSRWGVSEAEVLRRVIAETAAAEAQNPVELLDALHASGQGLSAEQAAAYLGEARQDRQN